ncbi:hypothetical protein R1flu_024846 [Riccia fluitans]|uniref:Reverse transcriptase n=1 Tax=Riccia fluitans TaxID=41844 RepID=A0ABD1XWJ4_9MARC
MDTRDGMSGPQPRSVHYLPRLPFWCGKGRNGENQSLCSKLQNKLNKWANRFLSWTSRVILLQHVLRTIPIYQFLGLGLNRSSYKQLKVKCRTFLWGSNSDNKSKTPLVKWDSITKLKQNGGLQIRPFQLVSDVLKMRYLGRLMSGDQADWVQMMRHFIRLQLQKRSSCREIRFWSAEEGLLLLPTLSIPESETTNNIVQSWLRCRKHLTLAEHKLILPGSITLRQLLELLNRYRTRRCFNDRVVYPLLKRLGVNVLSNLADGAGKWVNVAIELRTRGILLNQTQREALETFQRWLNTVHIGDQRLESSPSWRWRDAADSWRGWERRMGFWHKLLSANETPEDLTGKWPDSNATLTWKNAGGSSGQKGVRLA